MAATPSPEVIAAYQAGYTEVYSRVDLYEADTTTLWLADVPHIDGSISVDMTRDERRSGSLKLDNMDGRFKPQPGGFWYDKVIKVFRGIRYYNAQNVQAFYEIQLGEFTADVIDGDHFPHMVNVTMRDSTRKLLQAKFATSTTFVSGNPIETVISAIAQAGGIAVGKINLPTTGINTTKDFLFDRTTERWKAINDIATSYGYLPYFDNTGLLTMMQYTDPSNAGTSPSQFTFETGGRNLKNPRFSDLAGRRPRAYVLQYTSPVTTCAAILQSMGYVVTRGYRGSLPTAQALYDADIDLLVIDMTDYDVTSADLTVAYQAYQLGINVFTTGNDTTFSAGNPIWTGSTAVTAGQLQPTFQANSHYISEGVVSSSDTDQARYPTGNRTGTTVFAQSTYTVDSTSKPAGFAEQAGGNTQGSAGTIPARYVHLQSSTLRLDQSVVRRILRWLSNGIALPAWWNYQWETNVGGSGVSPQAVVSLDITQDRSNNLQPVISNNLMGNSSFELDVDGNGIPDGGWTGYGNFASTRSRVADAWVGTYSLQTDYTAGDGGGSIATLQDASGQVLNLALYRGLTICFSAYIKATLLAAGESIGLTLQGSAGPSGSSVNRYDSTQVGSWVRLYGTYTVGPTDTQANLIWATGGTAHWIGQMDGLQIEVGNTPTPYLPAELERVKEIGSNASVRVDVSSTGAYAFASAAIPVVPGEIYNISQWAKANKASQNGNYLRILFGTVDSFTRFTATSFTDIQAGQPFATDWQQISGQVTVPAGVSYMKVANYAWVTGVDYTAWFDDMQVDRLFPVSDTKGNLIKYNKKVDSSRIYNHVVVSGESTTTPPVYNQVENNTATSPTRIAKLGRRTYFYTSPFLTTTGQCLTVATNFLRVMALESYEISMDSLLTPWLEPGVVVTFNDPDSVSLDPVRYLLSDITIPIKPGPMSGNIKRVTVVG